MAEIRGGASRPLRYSQMRILLLWVIVGVLDTTAYADDGPQLASKAVVAIDASTREPIFGKAPDDVRPIASTTKIFVALAVREAGLDLDSWTEIRKSDAAQSRGGARTRLAIGERFRNRDLMRAMLLASDNRAPTALGRAAGMDADQLVAAMNRVAKRLGLKHTHFEDPTGLHGNVSTARELAIGLVTLLDDPLLRDILREESQTVVAQGGRARIEYTTTNVPLVEGRFDVLGGKTGFTSAAGYCFVAAARLGDRVIVTAFLGAGSKQARFDDFDRLAAWIERGGVAEPERHRHARRTTKRRTSR
jgi:D-alanyl-D-alanine endopeptidase (penicillin-binding protein 7)